MPVPNRPWTKIVAMLALLPAAGASTGCRPTAPPPSVLLVVVDTLRADMVGALRSRGTTAGHDSATPSLDRWAEGAVVFRRATTPAPFTMPAMAALLAGVYPDRCGVVAHEPGSSLRAWPGVILPEAAQRAGLATAAVVSNPWLARNETGFDRGFTDYSRLYRPDGSPDTSDAAAVTDHAIRMLDAMAGRRFFLWVHYFDPHMPYLPPPAFARAAGASVAEGRVMDDFRAPGRDLHRLYRGAGYTPEDIDQARRLYEGEVRYVDHEIGRLLERLESLGLAPGTLVIVASDHGESLGEHGLFFAHDYTLYDELTRVALLVRGPGVAAGARDDEVSLLDVAPTVCRIAALECSGHLDGRDLFAPPRGGRTLFAAATPLRSKGTPFDRLEVPGLAGRWTMALRDGKKLVRIPTTSGPVFEMYDLATDPYERRDISSVAADGRLMADLDAWSAAMDAARPPPTTHAHRGRRGPATRTLRSLGYLQ